MDDNEACALEILRATPPARLSAVIEGVGGLYAELRANADAVQESDDDDDEGQADVQPQARSGVADARKIGCVQVGERVLVEWNGILYPYEIWGRCVGFAALPTAEAANWVDARASEFVLVRKFEQLSGGARTISELAVGGLPELKYTSTVEYVPVENLVALVLVLAARDVQGAAPAMIVEGMLNTFVINTLADGEPLESDGAFYTFPEENPLLAAHESLTRREYVFRREAREKIHKALGAPGNTAKGDFNMHCSATSWRHLLADLDHEAVCRKSSGRGRYRNTTRGAAVRDPHAVEREEVLLCTEEELGGVSAILGKGWNVNTPRTTTRKTGSSKKVSQNAATFAAVCPVAEAPVVVGRKRKKEDTFPAVRFAFNHHLCVLHCNVWWLPRTAAEMKKCGGFNY